MVPIYDLPDLIKEWKVNVANDVLASDNSSKLAEYALHLSRVLAYPDLDVRNVLEKIDAIGEDLRSSIKNRLPLRPTQIIEEINHYLFKNIGFRANTEDYYNPLNSYLNIVLERKLGIPISLTILYIRIAYALNFKLDPVNFPTHFLTKHILQGEFGEIIIDPSNGGRIMDDYGLRELLKQIIPNRDIPPTRNFVEKATSAQVMIRMLNNLKNSYRESHDLDRTEIANEMILSIDQQYPAAIRDRGILLLERDKQKEGLEMLNLYLELDPEAQDADEILDTIRRIRTGMNSK